LKHDLVRKLVSTLIKSVFRTFDGGKIDTAAAAGGAP
jgi:hypothetical protein